MFGLGPLILPSIFACGFATLYEIIISWNVFDGTSSDEKPTSNGEGSTESGRCTNISKVNVNAS